MSLPPSLPPCPTDSHTRHHTGYTTSQHVTARHTTAARHPSYIHNTNPKAVPLSRPPVHPPLPRPAAAPTLLPLPSLQPSTHEMIDDKRWKRYRLPDCAARRFVNYVSRIARGRRHRTGAPILALLRPVEGFTYLRGERQ
jgi:hypothetical protein